jgi:hypothetical protein
MLVIMVDVLNISYNLSYFTPTERFSLLNCYLSDGYSSIAPQSGVA